MRLGTADVLIICGYLAAMAALGLWCRRRAARGMTSYFLGGRELPWWALSLSGSVSTFDITGTMWIVSLFFVLGIRSLWVHWMWGFLMAAFFMSYMGSWVRRSGVLTGAEWMEKRFGTDRPGRAARAASAILAVVTCVGFIAYATEGIAKFGSVFLPWSETTCALVIGGATAFYTLLGGVYSVVLTDVVQAVLVLVASVIITVLALVYVDPDIVASAAPAGWFDLRVPWTLPYLEGTRHAVYYFFGALVLVYVAKGLLLNAGGPQQIYDFQRFLAARNDRDAAKIGAAWSFFLCYRWSLTMGIAALAIVCGLTADKDPEKVLPTVLGAYLGPGVLGFVIAGFLAAEMSTFSSTVNGGASYLVHDLYRAFLRPRAGRQELVALSYATSLLIVVAGISFRFAFAGEGASIDRAFKWLMVALGGGVLLPNFLRWYWWRFNGWGYTAGIGTSVVAAAVQVFCVPQAPDYAVFPVLFAIGLTSSVAATYLTDPPPLPALRDFYRTTRPAGFWRPVTESLRAADPSFRRGTPFSLQLFNTACAGAGIVALYLFPVYLVLKQWTPMAMALGVAAACVLVLAVTWYRPLLLERHDDEDRQVPDGVAHGGEDD
jgi:Na+/proline symporter